MLNSSLFSAIKRLLSLVTLLADNQSQLLLMELEQERAFIVKLLLSIGCCLLLLFFTLTSLLLLLFLVIDPSHRLLFFSLTTIVFLLLSVVFIKLTLDKAKNNTLLPITRSRVANLRRLYDKQRHH